MHDRGHFRTLSMIVAIIRRYLPKAGHDHGVGSKPAMIMAPSVAAQNVPSRCSPSSVDGDQLAAASTAAQFT
jgi:hypothetical protein